MPGVKAVVTGADFPDLAELGARPGEVDLSKNVMARDKVLYEGHVVAAVAATTRRQAREAAAAIVVEYEPLPHVLNVDDAMAADAPLLHEAMVTKNPAEGAAEGPSNVASRIVHERGDLDKGFAEADAVVEREFTTKPVHQGYIEPHACVADVGSDGRAHLFVSSQGHFAMRALTAQILGWDTGRLKVTPAEIGGGFGGKTTIYVEPVATRLSEKAGRPVRIVMGRDEVFKATGPASGTRMRVKIGVANDGTFTAADVWMAYEAGAFAGSPV
ncbi:xanthine dehydrogenase family protein molybdopterin-binding subunit, partial [Okeania sp. SIO2B9]|uniref:xanthine dehydrogenase family protein molybdopterin-binding subunit n=1 Tax=Okeania sp. SIO2B9 TaxID=2607782 RepID=UPI00142C9C5D